KCNQKQLARGEFISSNKHHFVTAARSPIFTIYPAEYPVEALGVCKKYSCGYICSETKTNPP
ncbi:MAG TPA: hypothetical protein VF610_11870, partial [Segetibacter sp.]